MVGVHPLDIRPRVLPTPFWTSDPGYSSPPPSGHQTWVPPGHQTCSKFVTPLLVRSGGHQWGPVQTCSLEDSPPPPPLLTFSGGHRYAYGWQVGCTHPTGMPSFCTSVVRRKEEVHRNYSSTATSSNQCGC